MTFEEAWERFPGMDLDGEGAVKELAEYFWNAREEAMSEACKILERLQGGAVAVDEDGDEWVIDEFKNDSIEYHHHLAKILFNGDDFSIEDPHPKKEVKNDS